MLDTIVVQNASVVHILPVWEQQFDTGTNLFWERELDYFAMVARIPGNPLTRRI